MAHHGPGTVMMHPQRASQFGDWVEERTLGQGGFGVVSLWKHKETGDYLAVKKIRLKSELTEKHKQRWRSEVKIMLRLNHENVVKARELPPELTIHNGDLPPMAMEFCKRGDLRKILMLPQNAGGLPEYQIRDVLKDVAAGVEYLHNNRIIHRDLKPDNIVIQEVDDRFIYKVIDLGYAKDLDQGSLCTSFVGTMQYLAPELLSAQKYSSTVDYWSLGITAFECITGYRPFFHHMAPVQCHTMLNSKNPRHICGFLDVNGHTQFSEKIPEPHNMSSVSKDMLEEWLRLMLLKDQKARGGKPPDNSRPRCFKLLEDILKTKLVHVLSVPTMKLFSFPIQDHFTMRDLMDAIEQKTGVWLADQELLLASGISPDLNKPAIQCWSEPVEEGLVCLFSRQPEAYRIDQVQRHKPLPPWADLIVRESGTLLYNEQKKAWGQAVCACQEMSREFQRLHSAQRAAMLSLLRNNSTFHKLRSDLSKERESLRAKLEFFNESLDIDIKKYVEQQKYGIASEKLQKQWQRMSQEVQAHENYLRRLEEDYARWDSMSTRVTELNRSPYCRSRNTDSMGDVERAAIELYKGLLHVPKEERNKNTSNKSMVQCLLLGVAKRNQLVPDLYSHIRKVHATNTDMQQLLPKMQEGLEKLREIGRSLMASQKQRQLSVWKIVNVALQHRTSTSSTPSPMEGPGLMLSSGSSSQAPGNDILDKSSEESIQLMSENQSTRLELKNMLHDLKRPKLARTIDWTFLNSQSEAEISESMIV